MFSDVKLDVSDCKPTSQCMVYAVSCGCFCDVERAFRVPDGLHSRGPVFAAGHRARRRLRFFGAFLGSEEEDRRQSQETLPYKLDCTSVADDKALAQNLRGHVQRLAAEASSASFGSRHDAHVVLDFPNLANALWAGGLFEAQVEAATARRVRNLSRWSRKFDATSTARPKKMRRRGAGSHHDQRQSGPAVSFAPCRRLRRAHHGSDRPDAVFEKSVRTRAGRTGPRRRAAGDAGRMGRRIDGKDPIRSPRSSRPNRWSCTRSRRSMSR